MYTIDDKNYLNNLKITNPDNHQFFTQLLDELKSDLQKGCHDVRNVLALIVGNSQLLELNHPELTDDNRWLQIKEDLSYLSSIMVAINKVRYAHICHREKTNLHDLIYSISASYSNEIEVSIDTNFPCVDIDPQGVKFILTALLNNIYECDSTAIAAINVNEDSESVIICVSDNLSPIEGDAYVRMFQMFNTTKQNHIGLGLATSRLIAIAHNGTINYSYNNGNCFSIILKK